MEAGEREIIYLSLQYHHQNYDSCIKMGSDESHFNVSLIVRDSHKTVSTDQKLWKRKESRSGGFEPPRSFSVLTSLTPYPALGQTRLTVSDSECFTFSLLRLLGQAVLHRNY